MSPKMKIYQLTFLTLLFIVFGACENEITYTGNPIPKIRLISVSTEKVVEFADSFSVKIGYEDGDGNLGSFEADTLDIRVKDARLSEADFYHLPPLAPLKANVRIEGAFSLKLKNLFLIGSGNLETTTLEIQIKDRKQNWSNTVQTPTISISKS